MLEEDDDMVNQNSSMTIQSQDGRDEEDLLILSKDGQSSITYNRPATSSKDNQPKIPLENNIDSHKIQIDTLNDNDN